MSGHQDIPSLAFDRPPFRVSSALASSHLQHGASLQDPAREACSGIGVVSNKLFHISKVCRFCFVFCLSSSCYFILRGVVSCVLRRPSLFGAGLARAVVPWVSSCDGRGGLAGVGGAD